MVEILSSTEMTNCFQFRAQYCQKYASHKKKLQIKVVWNWISYKRVLMCICLSPHRSGTRGLSSYSNRTFALLGEIDLCIHWVFFTLLREIDICLHWVFCRKLNSEQFLFEFFFILLIFLAVFSHKCKNVYVLH